MFDKELKTVWEAIFALTKAYCGTPRKFSETERMQIVFFAKKLLDLIE